MRYDRNTLCPELLRRVRFWYHFLKLPNPQRHGNTLVSKGQTLKKLIRRIDGWFDVVEVLLLRLALLVIFVLGLIHAIRSAF